MLQLQTAISFMDLSHSSEREKTVDPALLIVSGEGNLDVLTKHCRKWTSTGEATLGHQALATSCLRLYQIVEGGL